LFLVVLTFHYCRSDSNDTFDFPQYEFCYLCQYDHQESLWSLDPRHHPFLYVDFWVSLKIGFHWFVAWDWWSLFACFYITQTILVFLFPALHVFGHIFEKIFFSLFQSLLLCLRLGVLVFRSQILAIWSFLPYPLFSLLFIEYLCGEDECLNPTHQVLT